MTAGTLFIVGLGPGDPELMTQKAIRVISVAPVVAYFAKWGRRGHACSIAEGHVRPSASKLRLEYPFTTEVPLDDPRYAAEIGAFYVDSAIRIAEKLDAGDDVALLCEGDPFFYGSAMYLFDRLRGTYRCDVIPGITGMSGGWARAGTPIAHGDDIFIVLPGTLDTETLVNRLQNCDAAVIIKIGRNLRKIRAALARADLMDRAIYIERGTMEGERILPFAAFAGEPAPYFSMVLVPGRQRAR